MRKSTFTQVLAILFVTLFLAIIPARPSLASAAPADQSEVTASVFDTPESENEAFRNLNNAQDLERAGKASTFYVSLVRSGNSPSCQVHVRWVGQSMIHGIRFRQMKVSSSSSLKPTVYGTIGNGSVFRTFYAQYATMAGTVSLGTVSVPTNIDTVNISTIDFQAYDLTTTSWNSSLYPLNGLTSIN